MKIIGKTKDGFLVEATEQELIHVAGYRYEGSFRDASPECWESKNNGGWGSTHSLKVGTEIAPAPGFKKLIDLRDSESSLHATGKTLRHIADMLEGAMPVTMIPPADETQAKPKGDI